MKRFFKKPKRWALLYALLLCAAFAFVLLDTFVIPKPYALTGTAGGESVVGSGADAGQADAAAPEAADAPSGDGKDDDLPENTQAPVAGEATQTPTSYQDENISITVEMVVAHDTVLYVADIQLSDATLLKTALANGVYGRNVKQTTSAMAEDNGAIFAINGDYYGFRDTGYVLRNGVLYRDTPGSGDALVIDTAGNLSVVSQQVFSAEALAESGAWQVLSFGPALVQDGAIVVGENEEISGKSKNSNPRTAIGQIDALHYIVIVSDGRTDESAGLSLYQLAEAFARRGAAVAYNLDGGGSSTMVLNGAVINTTTNGRSDSEREVSDIVYIGY
ncbi:MAG: phosphodiester glycosidase family protein [Ruminococcaceae bacterium]|nr:phosphodiester glycosidase family protein [Oscillospiraceae bacterium]